jgi:hypothetical protein
MGAETSTYETEIRLRASRPDSLPPSAIVDSLRRSFPEGPYVVNPQATQDAVVLRIVGPAPDGDDAERIATDAVRSAMDDAGITGDVDAIDVATRPLHAGDHQDVARYGNSS